MYEIWEIKNGTTRIVEQHRDPNLARDSVIELSRMTDAVYAVIREGFGAALYYAWRGVLSESFELLRRMSAPVASPVLRLEPPAPEETTVEDTPKPRRRKTGPVETKAKKQPEREYKASPAFIIESKASDDGKLGIVDAVVNLYGILDDGLDIVFNSFFAKSIAESGGRVRVLNSHSMKEGVLEAVGRPLTMREIGRSELPPEVLTRFPEATGGLWTSTQFMLTDERSKAVYDRLNAGWIDEWSIGFDTLQSENSRIKRVFNGSFYQYEKALPNDPPESLVMDESGRPVIARLLRQGRLWEYSPVLWGQNPGTFTEVVKSADLPADAKPYAVFPMRDEFCVFKVDDNDMRTGESLGCHATEDAAQAQIAAILVSENEDGKARKEYTPQGPVRRLGDCLLADMVQGGTSVLSGKLGSGMISADEFAALLALYTQHVNEFRAAMPDNLGLRAMPDDMFWFAADGPNATKVGRVLSERNFNKVKQASDLLAEVLSSAGLSDDSDESASADKSHHEGTDDGPPDAPITPTSRDHEAGPLSDEAPALTQSKLLEMLRQRLAEVEG